MTSANPTPATTSLTDNGTPSRVAKGEEFEIRHLVETLGLTEPVAKALLRRHGNDWQKIREEAAALETGRKP